MRPGPQPILHLQPHSELEQVGNRKTLDLIQNLNREHLRARDHDDELSARLDAYELAFRMQANAPELVELHKESAATLRCMVSTNQQHGSSARDVCLHDA